MEKDPVCGMAIDRHNPPARMEYRGRTYLFCSEDCRRQFEKHPERYATEQPDRSDPSASGAN